MYPPSDSVTVGRENVHDEKETHAVVDGVMNVAAPPFTPAEQSEKEREESVSVHPLFTDA